MPRNTYNTGYYYLNQRYLLNKMQDYLELQIKKNPHQYDNKDVKDIIEELKSGHCFGFANLWGEFMLRGNEQEFIDLFTKIAKFNGKITPDIENSFEEAISMVRLYHADVYNEKPKWFSRHDCESTEYVSDDNLIYLHQFNVNSLYEDQFTIEDTKHMLIFPKIINDNVYVEYFDEILKNCDNKFISMGGVKIDFGFNRVIRGHSIGMYCEGDEVSIYDSNYRFFMDSEGRRPVSDKINKKNVEEKHI